MKKTILAILIIVLVLFANQKLALSQNNWQSRCGIPEISTASTFLKTDSIVNGDSVIIIPTVFHVLTQGGPENVSKSHILKTLEALNNDFNRLNADTTDIPLPFHPLRSNPKVEFRLARIDPEGNCTDGIERIYTPLTESIDNFYEMQPNFSWDHTRYMNIYVVKGIDYDNFPLDMAASYIAPRDSGENLPEYYDVLMADYFVLGDGFNGVPPGRRGHIVTHEIGHNLSLYHVAGLGPGCTNDDDVEDTPLQDDLSLGCPDFPHITCNNGPDGDMFNNFMDYAECQNMFTQGQVDRMRTCLDRNEWRKSLWTPANLAATGADDLYPVCENPPVADFGYGNYAGWLCAGKPVQFYEATSWNPTSYQWEFEGGTPAVSSDSFPSVIFPDSGWYNIKLTVSNNFGSDVKEKLIRIEPAEVYYSSNLSESFEETALNNQIPLWTLANGSDWAVTDLAAYTGSNSIRLTSSLQYFSEFFTHIYDLSFLPGENRVLEFKEAMGESAGGIAIAGGLRVIWKRPCAYERYEILGDNYTGIECGALNTGDALLPDSLKTATTSTAFVPTASQWKTISLPIPDDLSGELQIGFLWGNFIPTNKFKGLYIDEIRIVSATGVSESSSETVWKLFPNPTPGLVTSTFSTVNGGLNEGLIKVTDLTGRVVLTQQQHDAIATIDLKELPDGMYMINLSNSQTTVTQNINKQSLVR